VCREIPRGEFGTALIVSFMLFSAVLRIQIRGIHMFLGLPDPIEKHDVKDPSKGNKQKI
jgi:hypothetical protein